MNGKWEDTFRDWASSPSGTEQTKCNNALGMIQNAINQNADLSGLNIKVFAQGSFRNRTNVASDSDVDICAVSHNAFFYDLPQGGLPSDFDITPITIPYSAYKNSVENAIVSYLGRKAVARGNKALNVRETTYHVDADVVACFEYRFYQPNRSYLEGTAFLTDKGIRINNWPEQNYQNGVNKNQATQQRFKSIVRVMKSLKNEMEGKGDKTATEVPSYLIECLVWNVPDGYFGNSYYFDDVRNSIIHLYNKTLEPEGCKDCCEINGIKYLFHQSQPWQYQKVNRFLLAAWQYVGFE